MSNIEKIRQEIERQRSFIEGLFIEGDNNFYDGQDDAYNHLLAFIDSLPEEKPSVGLEEAAWGYAYSWRKEGNKEVRELFPKAAYRSFIAGAEWRANQLLKGYPLPEDTVLFQKGVEEGRRLERDDLALTWEDMAKIDAIILDVNNEFAVDYTKEIDRQKFYEEVLKRFKEVQK